jgi:hypothetical protein
MIDGKPYLNLDPVSGRCMSCLISWARIAGEKSMDPPRRDVKLAQLPAHDDED